MGGMWLVRRELVTAVSEKVGYKSGLALTRAELREHLPEAKIWWDGDAESVIRVRSEEFEQGVGDLLYRLGAARQPWNPSPVFPLIKKYMDKPEKLRVLQRVVKIMGEVIEEQKANTGPYDLTAVAERARDEMGASGLTIALELLYRSAESLEQNAFTPFRRQQWSSVEQLADLFQSERLGYQYGNFVDQRFIDYLHRNFDTIDRVNWRKFEGLVCEYFEREGYRVEIGEGRNDGGIDARIWHPTSDSTHPPAVLVQCKRQRRTVDKVVVKALWADVLAERADSGLIVTTSRLSPGAKTVCTARGYSVSSVDRERLREWLNQMRTPGRGVFLGE